MTLITADTVLLVYRTCTGQYVCLSSGTRWEDAPPRGEVSGSSPLSLRGPPLLLPPPLIDEGPLSDGPLQFIPRGREDIQDKSCGLPVASMLLWREAATAPGPLLRHMQGRD